MVREFIVERLQTTDLTYLFPLEIISRLGIIVQELGIDLEKEQREAVSKEKELDALDEIVNRFFLGPDRGPLSQRYAHLPREIQRHLVYLIYTAMEKARALSEIQPDTPLGFPKGPQGILSNMLSASWIDLTEGGKRNVIFEPLVS